MGMDMARKVCRSLRRDDVKLSRIGEMLLEYAKQQASSLAVEVRADEEQARSVFRGPPRSAARLPHLEVEADVDGKDLLTGDVAAFFEDAPAPRRERDEGVDA